MRRRRRSECRRQSRPGVDQHRGHCGHQSEGRFSSRASGPAPIASRRARPVSSRPCPPGLSSRSIRPRAWICNSRRSRHRTGPGHAPRRRCSKPSRPAAARSSITPRSSSCRSTGAITTSLRCSRQECWRRRRACSPSAFAAHSTSTATGRSRTHSSWTAWTTRRTRTASAG